MRIACLCVPDFPLQSLRRSEPDLIEAPLVVASGHEPRDLVVAVSAEAVELGVRPGMTAAQARQVAPGVLVRVTPRAVAEAAEEALADVAASFSPHIKRLRPGEVLLDAGGLLARHGTEERLARDLLRACHRVGLDARVGIASSVGVARVAARCAAFGAVGDSASGNSLPASAGGSGGHEAAVGGSGAAGPPATDSARVGIASSVGVARVAARTAPPPTRLKIEDSRLKTEATVPDTVIARSVPARDAMHPAASPRTARQSSICNLQSSIFNLQSAIVPSNEQDSTAADPAVVIVPVGAEREFLAPLPLALLEPTPEISARLLCWGVHRAGELARLPRREVALRLAEDGVELHQLACGEEGRAFVPDQARETLKEGVWLEDAIGALDAFVFVLRALLTRLESRLELRGEGFAAVLLEIALEGGERREVRVGLVAPAREVAAVLALVRLQLEAAPPGAPVEGITAVVTPGAVQLTQGSLFGPQLPAPGKLAVTLTRLAALVGPDRVGAPAVPDTHRPGARSVLPFTLASAVHDEQSVRGRRQEPSRAAASSRARIGRPVQSSSASPWPRQPAIQRAAHPASRRSRGASSPSALATAGEPRPASDRPEPSNGRPGASIFNLQPSIGRVGESSSSETGPASGWTGGGSLVLRSVQPPREAEVGVARGRPVTVRVDGIGGAVVGYAGPYRIVGEWWGDEPFARDDFDVATADGALLRVYFDRFARRWYMDGVYD